MADPLSISASVLTVIAASITSVQTLHQTVKRYKERDETLARLQHGLEDLLDILERLKEAADGEEDPMMLLLKGPVGRCTKVCHDFENAMRVFSGKSKTGLRDWTRMEFMKGNINDLISTLNDYKSTIAIGLGTIIMRSTRITQQVVEGYNEMIQNTMYSLERRLERIDERLSRNSAAIPDILEDTTIDLDEKAVTEQCLRICENANDYMKSLQNSPPLLRRGDGQSTSEYVEDQFAAQLLAQKAVSQGQKALFEAMDGIRERLASLALDQDPEHARKLMREDLDTFKQCLDVCKQASSVVSSQKIHIIGEVTADDDCDQVVVTTVADLFNVGKVAAKNRSAQLIGSMTSETLLEVSKDRYGSRFGAVGGITQSENPGRSSLTKPTQNKNPEIRSDPGSTQARPSPNEVRRRRHGMEDDGAKQSK